MQHPKKMIHSLSLLWQNLCAEGIPADVLEQAIAHNSWFSPFFIQKSIENIVPWYEEKNIAVFLANYKFSLPKIPQNIGIIAAGNVPIVAWHDILMVVLSGNVAIVKLSHQDNVLIPYIVDKWINFLPEIKNQILFVPQIQNVAALIATGSNTTALQIDSMYADIPTIIRKNRFSAAIWDNSSWQNAQKLCEDILLYNGLGCRNVSNVLVKDEKELKSLIEALQQYPRHLLSANYLQKIQYERARLIMLNLPFVDAGSALLTMSDSLQSTNLGIINVVIHPNPSIILVAENEDVQCIVGKNIAFGASQTPQIGDFADGIDTLKWLQNL